MSFKNIISPKFKVLTLIKAHNIYKYFYKYPLFHIFYNNIDQNGEAIWQKVRHIYEEKMKY